MIGHILGSRASINDVLGSGRAAAAAASWWLSGGVSAANAIAVYQPIGAASLAASYDNNAAPGNGLADGTYDAAPGVAPTWASATGWTSGGASYLTTGVVPADGASMLVRYSVNDTLDNAICGELVGPASGWFGFRFLGQLSPDVIRFYGNGGLGSAPYNSSVSNGVLGVAGTAGYINGISVITLVGVAGATGAIRLMGYYGAETRYMQGSIQAFALYNTTLSAAQVAAISAAMAALTG